MPSDFLLSPSAPLDLATLRQLLTSNARVVLAADAYAPTPPAPATTPVADELRAYACGTGPELPNDLVRLLLLLRVQTLAPTAATAPTVQRLLDFYNREIFPVVYQQGDDAVAAAHLCLPLLGEGEVSYQGYRLQAADVLHLFSWAPVALTAAEVTALLAGAPLTLAYAVHGLLRLERLSRVAEELALPAVGDSPQSATRDALAYLQQVVEALCSPGATAAALSLPLDLLRLTAVQLGEQSAGRTQAWLATTDQPVFQPLHRTGAAIRRQNQQSPSADQLGNVLRNVEQLLGLELLVATQLRPEPTPLLTAFREQVLRPGPTPLPSTTLRAAGDFVRDYLQ